MTEFSNPRTYPVHPGDGSPIPPGGLVEATGKERWVKDAVAAGDLVQVQPDDGSGDDGGVGNTGQENQS